MSQNARTSEKCRLVLLKVAVEQVTFKCHTVKYLLVPHQGTDTTALKPLDD